MFRIMKRFVTGLSVLTLFACTKPEATLPVLGTPAITGQDTIYPVIRDFKFTDQDSNEVTINTFRNRIYVADFIFLSCPSICPKMNETMLAVYTSFKDNPNVLFLSHTIDPERDTIPRLKAFADNLQVRSGKWHFVTGNQDSIYAMADQHYFATAYSDSTAPGGYAHSGGLLLIDKHKHIRGVYDGTVPAEASRLIKDLHLLLKEQY